MRSAPAASPAAWASPWWPAEFLRHVLAVAEVEVRRLRHDPTELLTRAVQPALWLLVFGQVMGRLREVPTGNLPYRDYMVPGILAQSVLFISIFYGIQSMRERDMGLLQKYLTSPLPTVALVLGKALSAGVRGVCQATFIYLLAAALGVQVSLHPAAMAGVLAFTLLGAGVFSTFSLIIACIVRVQERLMGVGQVLTMPLFFASNAIYPLALMPPWLQALSHVNPLTYQVDAVRALMLPSGASAFGLGTDAGVLLVVFAALAAVAARLYRRLVM